MAASVKVTSRTVIRTRQKSKPRKPGRRGRHR